MMRLGLTFDVEFGLIIVIFWISCGSSTSSKPSKSADSRIGLNMRVSTVYVDKSLLSEAGCEDLLEETVSAMVEGTGEE